MTQCHCIEIILDRLAAPRPTRKSVAIGYANMLICESCHRRDHHWPAGNSPIWEQFGRAGLIAVKRLAWRLYHCWAAAKEKP